MKKKQLRQVKKISVLVVFFILALVVGHTVYNKYFRQFNSFGDGGYSDKYFVRGIDLSHHNPIIDWLAAAEQNISFAYLKATEGVKHEDRNYKYNYKQAKEANIKVGAYHFFSFGASGREQAAHFIRTAKCGAGDLIPAIDVEHSPVNVYSADTTYLLNVTRELRVLESELFEHYGVHPIIYTNKDCYKLYVKNVLPDNPVWICNLHEEPSDSDVPNWVIWQFSHKGKLNGVDGDVDLNYFRFSFDDLAKYVLP
ncbi:lysozyme [Dysgonomonas sp. PH5-45]|uniref:glycoside hydrolase family 25 protein n=1 Tax=unclassified Dysgonomonas TaxID=2630389 RepID=UPI0024760D17|nr:MULTISPECIES: GH25 family lysozyme [unclassified Dysgonomonas]MDH6354459.1 lysozyme [Dysgonomonas sp. PH5-45]MDH6387358.1 lysozyme [Dysgonomonas sp. PH5-37]